MIETVFRTSDMPAENRAEAWREQLSRTHAPLAAVGRPPADYRASQRLFDLGNVLVWPSASEPIALRRTPRLIRQSDPEVYHLSLITSGTVRSVIDGRGTVFGPCELRTNYSSQPFEVQLGTRGEPVEAVSVDIPRALLPLPEAEVRQVTGRRMSARTGIGSLVAGFLTNLARDATSYRAADAQRLETILADLLAALFAHELDDLALMTPETHRNTLVPRIHAFVRRHLHDAALDPAAIAAAHHISTSYLHRLFREQGSTVGTWIRQQRLERTRRDLGDPALAAVPVHRIASRWGFPHHPAFTRAFRSAYGMPPRDYRHLALGGGRAAPDRSSALRDASLKNGVS
ncbi:AraC family transcriptional regulator [Streptomyces sp. MAR4 CNY-716]